MIHVFIADDHEVVREGLKRIVNGTEDMRVVGEAADGRRLLSEVWASTADVLLLDISMPGPGFLEILRRLRHRRPSLRALVLSVHSEDRFALRALRAGASGYLTKNLDKAEIVEAIRRTYRGEVYASAGLAKELVRELNTPSSAPHARLSDREFDILLRIGKGERLVDIARALELSPKTVSTYRARILKKTRLPDNAAVVRYVLEHRLAEPPPGADDGR